MNLVELAAATGGVLTDLTDSDLVYAVQDSADRVTNIKSLRNKLIAAPGLVADGVTDDWTALQGFITDLSELIPVGTDGDGLTIQLPGMCAVSDTVVIPSAMKGLNIVGGGLIAIGNGWATTDPIMNVAGFRCSVSTVKIDCNKKCAGILNSGGNNTFFNNRVRRYQTYGMKEAGSTGGTYWIKNNASQWLSGDAEFANDSDWTAKGLWTINGDCKYYFNQLSQNGGSNFYAESPAQSSRVIGGHFFNGRSSGSASVNMNNIYVGPAAGGFIFDGVYLDNGRIELYTDNVVFQNCFGLKNSNASLDHWAALYGQSGRSNPDRFVWKGWKFSGSDLTDGTLPQLVVLPNPDDASTYSGDWSNLIPANTCPDLSMADDGTENVTRVTAEYVKKFRHVKSGSGAYGARIGFSDAGTDETLGLPAIGSRENRMLIETQHEDGVAFVTPLTSADGMKIRLLDDDTVNAPFIKTNADALVVEANGITLRTGNGTRVDLTDADGFIPSTDDTMDLGSSAARWNEAHITKPFWYPPASAPALTVNGSLTIEFTNNTTLTFKLRGSDGTTRSGTITLS